MSRKFGVIAEDKSDIEVITEILAKYIPRNGFSVKHFVGHGCGKLKQKCDSWARLLLDSGCEYVFIFHDLDKNKEVDLRRILEKKLPLKKFPNSLIVIPIEELEAWLLSDVEAIQKVFSLSKQPKKVECCEDVESPKEHLAAVVWAIGKKRYLNTIHNRKISEHSSLENFQRCSSFSGFDTYLRETVLR